MTTSPQAIPVGVTSSPPAFTFRDLEIGFTTTFQFRANSSGSGQETVGFWRPVPAAGFYSLGDFIFSGYGDVLGYGDANNNGFVATVKASQTGKTSTAALPPIAPPTGYEQAGHLQLMLADVPAPGASSVADSWPGLTASGVPINSAGDLIEGGYWFWRPIPPDGYVSLGLVISDPGLETGAPAAPATDLVMCVRSDLVIPAPISPTIVFSGHSDDNQPARLWTTLPAQAPAGLLYFNPGTFIGWNSESLSPPPSDKSAYSLILKVSEQPQQQQTTPPAPVLAGPWRPEDPAESVGYRVTLPWFAVTDPGMSSRFDQLVKSPNYHLDRVDTYTCVGFGNNATSAPQQQGVQWSAGTDGEQSKTFSETTGIEFDAGSQEAGVSVKLTQTFTYTTESSSGWSQSQSVSEQTTVPPSTAIAVFVITSVYTLSRADGSLVTSGVPYTGDNSTMCWAQYPPPAAAAKSNPG